MGIKSMTRDRSKWFTRLVIGLTAVTFGFVVGGFGGSAKPASAATDTSTQANFVNSGINVADPIKSGLSWSGHFADATNPDDISLDSKPGNTNVNTSAVNVKGNATNLFYVVTVKNITDQDLTGRYFVDFYDQDTAGYSGAGLRYGSTTNGVQTIDHDYTPSDDVSNVSATYGLTTEAAYSYWNEWDSLSDTQKSQIVRVRINFDLKAGKTVTFKLPVIASKAGNLIQANKIVDADLTDFTIIFGVMYSYYLGTTTSIPDSGSFNHNQFLAAYEITGITTTKDSATVQVGDTVNAATFGADPTDATIGTVTDANGQTVTDPTATAGTYTVELTRPGYTSKTVTLVVNPKPSNNGGSSSNNGGTTDNNSSSNNNSSSDIDTSTSPDTVIDGQTVAKKGRAIYGLKGLYMYNKATFKKSARTYHYAKQIRTKRPIFIVDGYTKSNSGALRYKVHDYYHKSRKGYITAKSGYTKLAYYFSVPKSKAVRVITSTGINSYAKSDLSGKKLKHYKKGTVLKVKKVVKYKLASRFQLTNGRYISGNKTFVIMK